MPNSIQREGWFLARVAINAAAFSLSAILSALLYRAGQSLFGALLPQQQQPTPTAATMMETEDGGVTAPSSVFAVLTEYHFWVLLCLFGWCWISYFQVSYAHFARGSFPYALCIGRGHDVVPLFTVIPHECRVAPGKVWRVRANPGWHPRLLVRNTPYRDGSKIFVVRNNDLVERVLPEESAPREPREFRHTSLGWIRRSFAGLSFLEPVCVLATGELAAWKGPGTPLLSDQLPSGMGAPSASGSQSEMGSRENSPATADAAAATAPAKPLLKVKSAEELIVEFCFAESCADEDEREKE